jgi:arylsulfatase A-like enzyme
VNVLLITLDQFRGDCLSAAGHPVVQTPNLDRLAAAGVRFDRHYSQAAPCAPGRACLYTGTYQLNNRVVANGTPLDDRFDNIARVARRAGYRPILFGYADTALDPRRAEGPDDPRLSNYQGVPPGFDVGLELLDEQDAWRAWLQDLGYGTFPHGDAALASEPDRPAEHGVSAFLADHVISWLAAAAPAAPSAAPAVPAVPWFVHASFWRPHPPFAAAGHWSRAYDPDLVPAAIPAGPEPPPSFGRAGPVPAPPPDDVGTLRAQYYGMISDVDHQLGRLLDALIEGGMWDDTMVIVTADHGELLGDHGLTGKGGPYEESYRVLAIVRDPRHPERHGTTVDAFTENVDVMPTVCDAIGQPVPAQCDGLPLTPFLVGAQPPWWREAAHWEYDWRWEHVGRGQEWPWDRRLERQHLAVLRSADAAYVQFGSGEWRCYDLAADPTWRTPVTDPSTVLAHAQAMLTWRSQHTERTMTDMLLYGGVVGRPPAQV